jgi:tripartite-type tricarboxylate transporter receptor subunit TctC
MKMTKAVAVTFCAVLATCGTVTVDVAAQSYPNRPVRLLVGFAPGGAVDIAARVIANQLTASLGQSVIVENRAGATGNLAADFVAKAPPDGYTLLIANTTIATPSLFPKLPFDIGKDLLPVSLVALGPHVFVVHPSFPASNAKELIALAKVKPKQVLYGSAGVGNISQLEIELFASMSNISMVHVAYKGTAPALVALMSGEVQLVGASIPSAVVQINAGKIKPLGVSTLKRSSVLPNVPTIAESGLPGYEAASWYGLFAPAGVAAETLQVLNKVLLKIMANADVRERFARDGFDPVGSNAGDFAQFIRTEIAKWDKVIKTRRLVVE